MCPPIKIFFVGLMFFLLMSSAVDTFFSLHKYLCEAHAIKCIGSGVSIILAVGVKCFCLYDLDCGCIFELRYETKQL